MDVFFTCYPFLRHFYPHTRSLSPSHSKLFGEQSSGRAFCLMLHATHLAIFPLSSPPLSCHALCGVLISCFSLPLCVSICSHLPVLSFPSPTPSHCVLIPCLCCRLRLRRLRDMEEAVRSLLGPGSWVVQGTLGLAYPASFESHVQLAEWCVRRVNSYWGGGSCVALGCGVLRGTFEVFCGSASPR